MTDQPLPADRPDSSDPGSIPAAPRVSFQGELGAYGDEAIIQQWQGQATAVPAKSFEHVVDYVTSGFADFGIIPVWNSIVGEITSGVATIQTGKHAACPTHVLGDIRLMVRHQLLGLRGSALDDIRSVASHPVALAQCTAFLRDHPRIKPAPYYDTAGAAHQLGVSGLPDAAAIAGRQAAKRYDLSILHADIQDIADNVTQFLVITRSAAHMLNAHHARQTATPISMLHSSSTGSERW